MSDLIRRSEVIDVLKQTGIIQDNDLGHLVIDEINRIQTAYDVDKVIEELEKIKAKCLSCGDIVGCTEFKKAIEIVKQGCISDDVCEWKEDHTFNGLFKSCGGYEVFIEKYKYCPYCSKKIKVVLR